MKIVIIYGTSTDVGKTFLTVKYISRLKSRGKKVFAIKPVLSGYTDDGTSDSALISKALGLSESEVCKYQFKAPVSPNIAAKFENIELNFASVVNFCKLAIEKYKSLNYDYFIIETAGGAYSPIASDGLCIDLSFAIPKSKSVLITSNYLGCISNTISAVKCFNFDVILFNNKGANTNQDYCNMITNTIKQHTARRIHCTD